MRRLIAALASCATLGAVPLVTAGPAAADPGPEPFFYTAPDYDVRGPYIGADNPWSDDHRRHHGDRHQWDGDRPWDGDRDDDDRCKDDDHRRHWDGDRDDDDRCKDDDHRHHWDSDRPWDGDDDRCEDDDRWRDDDRCKDDDRHDDNRWRESDRDENDNRWRESDRDENDDRSRDGDRDWGYNYRYVTSLRCRIGGGTVVRSWHSPTRLSCYGGRYNGYWVVSYGL
ncbi:hypothetical protein [Nonomuraea sp. NPDC052265]|uniref:hypothetical protein n=1 Tax=Nonomuraea sp. NPDC052265 TaxID=3364374 RepID=UPI0037C90672